MKYFKISQFVPGKGDAWTYYECDDDGTILRQLTYIPTTNEINKVSDPIVKKLYRPDLLTLTEQEEFISLWNK
ncbi:MAG TPA: hypothetical protein PLT82_07705 [Candidatus Hydrogenedens sp.]|nr:hypothetical protein [Candidatus Hydrogenedens sp.]HOK09461.1 hypothetical protein [Candidatus Hydrogenedens sp.]HOL18948.1 hypothetical protein [Candidatus Hydrogenedens sp.]HPP59000.1 hypothetical protein [Candidatus Hydrogenedens sp.]